ncbi:MAG: cysteine hydrolase, partial [Dehalococcoidia bacterium]|nr:cysteine hydrolase [Dehalococcoidia bacterium]
MMAQLDVTRKTTALLVMDCQEGIVGALAPSEREKVLTNLSRAITGARKAGIPIIYVVVQFREGYPEISERNINFRSIKESGRLREGAADAKICRELSPQPGDVVVTKKRISAFTGSDLEAVLRSKGIDTLVLTGVSSLGVVESTARFAFDMDYGIYVLGDCCSDSDPEANDIAVKRLLPRISTVCSADDFIAGIS